jgi:putative polyketide hydroxylase/tetracenomycin A2 monooxygenase-dioxygenase
MTEPKPVAIVGGGPVGLSAAIVLARFGVRCRVFEQAPARSAHPKARGVRIRTMELFRQWGLEPELRARSLPPDALRFIYCDTLAGDELARTDELEPRTFAAATTSSCRVAQDAVEQALVRRASAEASIEFNPETRVVALDQSADGVTVRTADGDEYAAAYVIAADGVGSTVRRALGIELAGERVVSWWRSVYWSGDLDRWAADRPCIQFVTGARTGRHVQIASVDGRHRWVTLIASAPGEERPADLGPDEARAAIRGAIGDPLVEVDIHDIATFRISAQNATSYRSGRVFLAGDAAHALPPTGGMGMNSGIQDVHNLAWKLAFVLNGWADSRLLDSYDSERRPVADNNIAWSRQNGKRFGALRVALAEADAPRVAELLGEQRDHVSAVGQDLGFAYAGGAIVPDGTPPPPASPARYRPTARPGHRAPAVWLDADRRRSTLDLYDTRFVLLVGHEARLGELGAQPWLDTLRIGEPPLDHPESDLHEAYGISATGAVLVRPDGHVAWRAERLPSDPAAGLGEVFARLGLGLGASAAVPGGRR